LLVDPCFVLSIRDLACVHALASARNLSANGANIVPIIPPTSDGAVAMVPAS
jgi:hypothetical protein